MRKAVIVSVARSPIAKAIKGSLKYTKPEDYAAQVIRGMLAQIPQMDPVDIDDLIVGNSLPEAEQGYNIARSIALNAGLGHSVGGQTINRFCASGLQTIAAGANAIMAEQMDVVLAGGVETMTFVPMGGNFFLPENGMMDSDPTSFTAMGHTAENVARMYGVTREEQDQFAMESHHKAEAAIKAGKFVDEIIPIQAVVPCVDENGNPGFTRKTFSMDEGVRPNMQIEALQKLRTVFDVEGSVTAATSSQMSDGAAFVLLMSEEKAAQYGLTPIAEFVGYAAKGVDPALMGIGPMAAVPAVMERTGLTVEDMSLIEINEAFAAQSIACIRELGFNKEIVNVNGGACALGHPLGCTGAYLTCKLLMEMRRRDLKDKYGLVTMCVGGGQGSAGIFKFLQ